METRLVAEREFVDESSDSLL
ncbi:unnamed protein product, partial [Adineta steineri]